MASHTGPSVAQVQQEFQALLAYGTGPATTSRLAYEVERLVFLTRAADRPDRSSFRPPSWL